MLAPSPFEPPKAELETTPAFAELNWKSPRGRIGRLRYMAWSCVLTVVFIPAFAVFAVLGYSLSSVMAMIAAAISGVIALVVGMRIGAQRLHDIGWSAWWLLLMLVPLANNLFPLLLMLVPGNLGANRFGPPPPPNTTAVKALAVLAVAVYLLIFMGGFVSGLLGKAHSS